MKNRMKPAFWLRRLSALWLCAVALWMPISGRAIIETEISPLPWEDTAGYQPNPEGYSEDGYWDESIDVDIVETRRADASFYAAFVKIQHPSQLRTGLASSLGAKRKKTTDIAEHYNAVVAINGDFYTERDKGITIRQGEVLRESVSKLYDMLLIDQSGNFHIVSRDQPEMLEVFLSGALTIQNAFSFGPALVVDGQVQEIPEKYSFAPHYKNPRAAIGQLGELSYVLVVVDGRQQGSDGVTLEALAEYMGEIGCIQAFNLDGGGSATLVLDGEVYNTIFAENERSISDIVYFASTVDPIQWGGEQEGEQ